MSKRVVRRLLVTVVTVLLLACAGAGAAWWTVTGRMVEALPQFVAVARQEGWIISYGAVHRAAWPGVARVHVADVVTVRPLGSTRVRLTLKDVALSLDPRAARVLRIEAGEAGTVQVGDGEVVPLRARQAALLVPLDGAGASVVAIEAISLGSDAAGVRVGRVDARIEPGTIQGSAGPIVVAPPFSPPFEQGATVSGRVTATPPIPFAATPGESARAWQAGGGRMEASDLLLEWGRLRMTGAVSGGLDAGLQPVLDARLQVVGAPEMLDAAVQAGVVGRGPGAAANAVLGLLTLAAKGGPITVPVQLREQTLTVAQFPLLRLPALAWDPP